MPKKTSNSQNSPRMAKNRAVVINGLLDRLYKRLWEIDQLAYAAGLMENSELINELSVEVNKLDLWRDLSRRRTLTYRSMNNVREQYPTQWMTYHGIPE